MKTQINIKAIIALFIITIFQIDMMAQTLTFDPNQFYRITNNTLGKTLSLSSSANTGKYTGIPSMAKTEMDIGQLWCIRAKAGGYEIISAFSLNLNQPNLYTLKVVGITNAYSLKVDNTASAANSTWQISSAGNNIYTLSNSHSGASLKLGSNLQMKATSSTDINWSLTPSAFYSTSVCNYTSDNSVVILGSCYGNSSQMPPIAKGICWSKSPIDRSKSPKSQSQDSIKYSGSGFSLFNATVNNLSPSTKYYARSFYSWGDEYYEYGYEVNFTTLAAAKKPHWDYTADTNWYCLGYKDCGGAIQSPIALSDNDLNDSAVIVSSLPAIQTNYNSFKANLYDNGHSLNVENKDASIKNTLTYNGVTYNFVQFHFHTPSEHTINGESFIMEIHIVHEDPISGAYLVLAMLLGRTSDATGKTNFLLNNILNAWPTVKNQNKLTDINVNINDLLLDPQDMAKYYQYTGSLTTPPCTQGVTFLVVKNRLQITDEVLSGFKTHFHNNNARPIQPLNNRVVSRKN